MTVTIGQIDYANCTPIFKALIDGYDCGDYSFIRGVPSQLNSLLRRGEIDVCPSSSIEYAMSPDRYCILPDLSISSIGPVKSVLLFCRQPLQNLDGATIGLTTESATSVNLLKIILGRFLSFSNHFVSLDLPVVNAVESSEAFLLIGDQALKAAQTVQDLHVYDLGELWYRFTGLPFVFALWMVTTEAVETRTNTLHRLSRQLVAAKRSAYESYRDIAASCAERTWIGCDALVSYWKTISYDLTDDHLAGVKTFFAYAAEMGLLPSEPEIRLFR